MTHEPVKTYSDRELDRIFKSHEEKMLAGFDSIVEKIKDVAELGHRIEEQTIKTNGRVTAIENWRENMRGAWRLITWVGIPLFMIFATYISWLSVQVLELPTKEDVKRTVAEQLSSVEVQITK